MLPHPAGKGSSLVNGMGHKEARTCLLGSTLTKRPGLVCKEGVCGAHSGPGVCRQTEVKGLFNHVCFYIWGDKQLWESQSSFITKIGIFALDLMCFFFSCRMISFN